MCLCLLTSHLCALLEDNTCTIADTRSPLVHWQLLQSCHQMFIIMPGSCLMASIRNVTCHLKELQR